MTGSRQQVPARFADAYGGYADLLENSALDAGTRRAYDSRVRSYLAWLGSSRRRGPDPLADPGGRDTAIRAYLADLRETRRLAASTLNAHLTALYHFYDYLGLGSVRLRRDEQPRGAPRPLSEDEQRRWLAAVRDLPRARDRAIGQLLLRSGILPSELTALDLADVQLAGSGGTVAVRGAGQARTIPLQEAEARADLAAWHADRAGWPGAGSSPALILNRRGGRLTPRAVGQLAADLAEKAGLLDADGRPDAAPRRLRITYAANLIRAGADLATVGDRTGLRDLEAIRLAVLPAPAGGQETGPAGG